MTDLRGHGPEAASRAARSALRCWLDDTARVLTFREPGPGVREHPRAYAAFGLLATWLAGVGRTWDDPEATLVRHLGVHSLLYVLGLSGLLWTIGWAMVPRRWSYRNVLTFVTFTAPPALLYAIPVERFLPMATAIDVNVGFVAIVAAWRVLLCLWFLARPSGLGPWGALVGTLLPISLILSVLGLAQLQQATFDVMGGLHTSAPTAQDGVRRVVGDLTILSMLSVLPLLLAWAVTSVLRRMEAADHDDADRRPGI